MGLKDVLLNKGWAGTTMSRAETVDRFNPIIRAHYELNNAYAALAPTVRDADAQAQLHDFLRIARMDVGKLAETVLSSGGTAFNGVELRGEQVTLGDDEATRFRALRDREEAFLQMVSDELSEEHHVRSKAILGVVRDNSKKRLEFVRGAARAKRG